ncbi:dihydrofolate reductase family protein [Tepidiforma sp.]|uniref:dihydrofolate reductase family protein n=1 Tax=Tepidiforma sp. TaxID=2682230 RepID=UPI002ADE5790|nr:dihydrofolate reductase family protein [Tepidiforma sp.]
MKILVTEFMSLDGVVQAPGAPIAEVDAGFPHAYWMTRYMDPEVIGGVFGELSAQSDALLQGRHTYLMSASAWPSQSGFPFADWINRVQKYVVSDTLSEDAITWQPTTIIRGKDFLATVRDLRQQPGGYVYIYGSRAMVQSLLAADLVDELVLTMVPVVFGTGTKLFPALAEPLTFDLVSTARASTGAQIFRYARVR